MKKINLRKLKVGDRYVAIDEGKVDSALEILGRGHKALSKGDGARNKKLLLGSAKKYEKRFIELLNQFYQKPEGLKLSTKYRYDVQMAFRHLHFVYQAHLKLCADETQTDFEYKFNVPYVPDYDFIFSKWHNLATYESLVEMFLVSFANRVTIEKARTNSTHAWELLSAQKAATLCFNALIEKQPDLRQIGFTGDDRANRQALRSQLKRSADKAHQKLTSRQDINRRNSDETRTIFSR